jgi:hypothetical protein
MPMSFIRRDGPQAHDHTIEGSCQQGEIRLGQFLSPPERAHGDKEIGKKRRREPGTRCHWAEPVPDGTGRSFDPSVDRPGR